MAATRPGPAQAAARAAAATPDPWFCTCCGGQNPGPAARCDGCGTVAAVRAAQPAGGDHGGGPGSARLALLAAPLLLLAVVIGGSLVAERTERRGRYLAAEAALAAGQYADADAAFAAAAGYRDAVARRAALAAARAPVAAARADAVAALAAGRYEAAIAALLPVARRFPGDGDVAPLLAEARALHRDDLAREASAAEARRDWLAAERALAALVAADPAAPEPAARLGAVRREHAPLVVARDRALWLVDPASAEPRLLTDAVPAARPVWSPDRTKVAFISAPDEGGRAAAALYVIAADGSGLRQLSASVHPSALPAWSPEGGRIAYTSVADWDLRRGDGRLAVHVVDLGSGRDRDATATLGPTGGAATSEIGSGRGSGSGSGAGAVEAGSGGRRHAMSPWWTPDGRLAVIGRAAGIDPGQPATGPGDLFLVDLASGKNENVTRGRVPDLLRAFWSPRGDRALLTARAWHGESGPLDARADLIALDPASGALVPLAEGIDAAASAWAPAWSPDGSEVAYLDGFSTVAFRGEGGAETRRVAVDGALSGALTWAPGGAAVLAVAADPGQPSRIIDLGSDPPTTVALRIDYDADWRAGVPQWGPVMPAPPVAPVGISGLGLDPAAPPAAAVADGAVAATGG